MTLKLSDELDIQLQPGGWKPSPYTALLYLSVGFIRPYNLLHVSWCQLLSCAFTLMHHKQEWLLCLPFSPDVWRIAMIVVLPGKISHCKKLQSVVLPEQSTGLVSDQSSSLDLLQRFLIVVRATALVKRWVVPISCVIPAVEKVFVSLCQQFFLRLYIKFQGIPGKALNHVLF